MKKSIRHEVNIFPEKGQEVWEEDSGGA